MVAVATAGGGDTGTSGTAAAAAATAVVVGVGSVLEDAPSTFGAVDARVGGGLLLLLLLLGVDIRHFVWHTNCTRTRLTRQIRITLWEKK